MAAANVAVVLISDLFDKTDISQQYQEKISTTFDANVDSEKMKIILT